MYFIAVYFKVLIAGAKLINMQSADKIQTNFIGCI